MCPVGFVVESHGFCKHCMNPFQYEVVFFNADAPLGPISRLFMSNSFSSSSSSRHFLFLDVNQATVTKNRVNANVLPRSRILFIVFVDVTAEQVVDLLRQQLLNSDAFIYSTEGLILKKKALFQNGLHLFIKYTRFIIYVISLCN
mmetsp:Transcript_21969/g.25399  ORF Transcript_21969/g.25399 Transcript_21969/m.25399 type:complete len:145 (-) Transcript_21969:50-484(-)